jgi:hypothetical protein
MAEVIMRNLNRHIIVEADALRLAVGEAFSATLLGVSQRELDITLALADRLLTELRKRGLTVTESGEPAPG